MTISISGMAPIKINSTVLPVQNVRMSPAVAANMVKHSGNEFAGVGAIFGAMPKISFQTPLLGAYNLIGLKMLLATTFEYYLATFASGLRQPGATHSKYGLSASATACVYITGASVDQNGIAMANVEVLPLAFGAINHPLTRTDSVALAALASEPQLHTLGPITLAGARVDGLKNGGFSQNIQLAAPINDGDQFPRTCAWLGADPQIMGTHEDPFNLLTTLGLLGTNLPTGAALWFRGIDPTTQLLQSTGMSFTIGAAAGRAIPGDLSEALGRANTMGVTVRSLSSTTTHPFTVATAGTVP